MKSIEDINTKISEKTDVVWTESEFKNNSGAGETVTSEDVDGVT